MLASLLLSSPPLLRSPGAHSRAPPTPSDWPRGEEMKVPSSQLSHPHRGLGGEEPAGPLTVFLVPLPASFSMVLSPSAL